MQAPEVECIGKGKAHRPYELGVKVSVATTIGHAKGGQFVTHVKALPGNPSDGHTLATVIPGDGGAGRQYHLAHPRGRGLPRPQRAAGLQPETGRDTPGSNASYAAGPPSNPRSAISKPNTAWAASASGTVGATLPTPSSQL